MQQTPPRYQTFLLILWEERSQDPRWPPVWRFRLEDPRTGQKQGFANIEGLVAALQAIVVCDALPIDHADDQE